MNAVGQQMAGARGGGERRPAPGAGPGLRDREPATRRARGAPGRARWAGWAASPATATPSTLTYNFGGAAAGIDYRLDPRFLVGIGAGYAAGNQWVDSFMGRGWSDSVSVAAYGSLHARRLLRRCAGGLRLLQQPAAAPDPDPRPAAAHRQRQHRRQPVPRPDRDRLQARRLRAGAGHAHAVRPPAGLDRAPRTASANGARSRSTSASRSRPPTRCAPPSAPNSAARSASAATRTLDLALRLGWQHEFADTGRPITAAFAGAPANAFTVYGATPQRDCAVIGFSASTAIADGDLGLPPLRRRDRRRHRQPRPQRRRAHDLVKVPISDRYRLFAR